MSEDAAPQNLAETHLFLNGDPTQPHPELIPYAVKVPLWSDGAVKTRFLFLPSGQSIGFDSAGSRLLFPTGTMLVKHFSSDSEPQLPIETRIMILKSDGKWRFSSFVWSEDGTVAELNQGARKIRRAGKDYRIPSEKECASCHGDPARALGFKPEQLNFNLEGSGNQLALLTQKNVLSAPLESTGKLTPLDDPTDTALSYEKRARAYMDVNCAPCHQPAGLPIANRYDFRREAVDTKLISSGKIIPGNPEASILWQRLTAESERMPAMSLRKDPVALEIFRAYIESIPKSP